MKNVGKSSLHNKPQEDKIRILMELREKKDIEEKIRLEQKKKDDAEKLENYYISLKNKEKELGVLNTLNTQRTQLRRSFFATDMVEITQSQNQYTNSNQNQMTQISEQTPLN